MDYHIPLAFAGIFITALAANTIRRRLIRAVDSAEAFLATAAIASMWIVVSGAALGFTGNLSLPNRIAADLLFLTLAYLIAKSIDHSKARKSPEDADEDREYGFGANVLAYDDRRISPATRIIIILATLTAAALWTWGWVSPPPPWDSFVYHLTFPASWIKAGAIYPVTVPFGDQGGTYFPSNTELIYMWILQYFAQDFATNILQWFLLAMAGTAVFRIARHLGAVRDSAICAGVAVFFIPGMAHQSVASEVDIAFSTFFCTALYFLLRWDSHPRNRHAALFACATAGLFLGTKSIALVWTLFFLAPIALYSFIRHRKPLLLITGAFAVIATGGFWIVRNFILTGNPVFPLTIELMGHVIFDGAYTKATMLNSVFHTGSFREWLTLLTHELGTGTLALITLATAGTLSSRARPLFKVIFTLILPAILLICFFLIPYNRETRFAFSASLLALAAAAAFSSNRFFGIRVRSAVPYLIALVCAANVFSNIHDKDSIYRNLLFYVQALASGGNEVFAAMRLPAALIAAAGFLAAATVSISLFARSIRRINRILIPLAAIAAIAGISTLAATYPKYQFKYYSGTPMGHSWEFTHSIVTGSAGIAFTGTDLSYALFGPRLANHVYHVPVNRHGFRFFHQCNNYVKETGQYTLPQNDRIDFCRREPDYDKWYSLLKTEKTDLLYVSVLHQNDLPTLPHDQQGFPIERAWADTHPESFRLLYMTPVVHIYQVK